MEGNNAYKGLAWLQKNTRGKTQAKRNPLVKEHIILRKTNEILKQTRQYRMNYPYNCYGRFNLIFLSYFDLSGIVGQYVSGFIWYDWLIGIFFHFLYSLELLFIYLILAIGQLVEKC